MFLLGEKDLTTQSVRETQDLIQEELGVNSEILARTMFHGQHHLNGLLESTDAKLKEELALVVPLSAWQEASLLARSKSRDAAKESSALQGKISLREQDLQVLETKLQAANKEANARRKEFQEVERRAKESATAGAAVAQEVQGNDDDNNLSLLKQDINTAYDEVRALEDTLAATREKSLAEIGKLQAAMAKQERQTLAQRQVLQSHQLELEKANTRLESAKELLAIIEKRWDLDDAFHETGQIRVPDVCPTCLQPIGADGSHHGNDETGDCDDPSTRIEMVIHEELDDAQLALNRAKTDVVDAKEKVEAARASLKVAEREIRYKKEDFDELQTIWNERIGVLEEDLKAAKNAMQQATVRFADNADRMQRSMDATTNAAEVRHKEESFKRAQKHAEELYEEVKALQKSLTEMKTKSEELRAASATYTSLTNGFGARGVQTFVLQNAVEGLQFMTQSYLEELSDESIRLQLELDSGDRILRRAFVRAADGEYMERPLASLSGGQWRRCSLALSLGFIEMIARRGRLRPSLMVLDEPLTHLDRTGRTRVGALMKALLVDKERIGKGIAASTILLILQDLSAEELEESFDRIDEVVRRGGNSFVKVDEYF